MTDEVILGKGWIWKKGREVGPQDLDEEGSS